MNVEQRRALNKAVKNLDELDGSDVEAAHVDAEEILLSLLRSSGLGDAAQAFEQARDRVDFWYA